ncbi:DUF6584 family protein [Modestobacter versicolor]|uniref:Uncharacterized protein n=1 Tax=Modestobacter versicolor TaxID=429133 RepID=A0A323V889_9ACTN|nr:DUF6584 family protein [Modestobacter versicolor]MBB3675674.1 hypothetical protein [Modestobacter versicolor]PZA20270.1 hypothetical protein DMO24_16320 [Modestobacter versicolor]
MPVEQTLTRVAGDLVKDRVDLARRRLRGLVEAFPHRLDLRERLADTYRRTGDAAQAGRWAYLGGAARPEEVAAFEALYPHPDRRLEALRWPDGSEPGDPLGRRRLQHLRAHSAALADGSAVWVGPPRRDAVRTRTSPAEVASAAGCLLVAVVLLALVVVGAVVVVRALVG